MMPAALVSALALSVLTSVAPGGSADADLAETIDRFETLRLSGSGSVPVRNLPLTSGHLTLLLKSGNAALVRAGNEIVGLFFEGQGDLEYRSADPIEFPAMTYNLKKASSLAFEKGAALTVRDRFERVLWLAAGTPLPELPGSAGPSLEASLQKQREKFRKARASPTSHFFAVQHWNAPQAALVAAEIDGGKEDLRYFFDEVTDRTERLELLRKASSADSEMRRQLFPVTLSEQPIGRDRRDPLMPPFFLTDVRVDLIASEGKDAALTVTETIAPQGGSRSVLAFSLSSTVYDISGIGALKPRTYRVKAVTDEAGKPLSFHHQNGEILVGLRAPAAEGQPVKLTFDIAGDFLIRPAGDSYWLLGVEPWFPQPDLAGQFYTFHSIVKVKKPFVPFASGRTLSRRIEGEYAVVETEIDKPVQFAVVLAGRYELREETREGMTVRVATYAGKNERAMKQLTNLAFDILKFYERFLGPFPFTEFDILEINEYGFGQAPPGVMFITKEAFNPLMGEENRLFSGGVNERFAHEIAHQYWAYVVKMPNEQEQWLSESFAEYSAALFLKAAKGSWGSSMYESVLRQWKTGARDAGDAAPIPLANRVVATGDPEASFRIRTGLLYCKGPLLLAALHKELGDQTFLTALKSYQKTFRWKFGSTKTFEGLLEWLTKKDYKDFFEKYYWGTAMPPG
jgi:Peptidase family M1 domain